MMDPIRNDLCFSSILKSLIMIKVFTILWCARVQAQEGFVHLRFEIPTVPEDMLAKPINKQHHIFQRLNMVKYCDALKTAANGYYFQNIHLSQTYYSRTIFNRIQYDDTITSEPIWSRNCQLLRAEGGYVVRIFVTAFLDDYYPLNTSADNTVVVLECFRKSICRIVALATVSNFRNTFPIYKITTNNQIKAETFAENLPTGNSYSISVFTHTDIRPFCDELKTYFAKTTKYKKNEDFAHVNVLSEPAWLKLSAKDTSGPQFHAKRCALKSGQKAELLVTTMKQTKQYSNAQDTVIALACSKKLQVFECRFKDALIVEGFDDFYPGSEFLFENIKTVKILDSEITWFKGHSEIPNILQNININLFCERIHNLAKGYYVRNTDLTQDRFRIVDISLSSYVILKSGNATSSAIKQKKLVSTRGRNCQLAKASNTSQQIFLTGWSIQSNIILLLACTQKECEREAVIIVNERSEMLQIQGISMEQKFLPKYNLSILNDIYSRSNEPHRILQNIDMFGFCQTLLEIAFDGSYQSKSTTNLHDYRITERNHLRTNNTITSKPVRTRSCQLKKEDNEENEIFVTISPSSINDDKRTPYLARDNITVLLCQNSVCTLEGVLNIENFEYNFPILDIIFDNTLNATIQRTISYSVNPHHRIFRNISMNKFCNELRALSGKQYAELPRKTKHGYDIHNHYTITNSANSYNGQRIFSRSCQLRKVDNWKKEIVLVATSFNEEYQPVRDRIIILECVKKTCTLQTTVIMFDLEQKYHVLDRSINQQHYTNTYKSQILHRLPGINEESSIFQAPNLRNVCAKLTTIMGTLIEDTSNPKLVDTFPITFVRQLEIEPYLEGTIYARSCLTIEHEGEPMQIKLTTPPKSFTLRTSQQGTLVNLLLCRSKSGICMQQNLLSVINLQTENPTIRILDDDSIADRQLLDAEGEKASQTQRLGKASTSRIPLDRIPSSLSVTRTSKSSTSKPDVQTIAERSAKLNVLPSWPKRPRSVRLPPGQTVSDLQSVNENVQSTVPDFPTRRASSSRRRPIEREINQPAKATESLNPNTLVAGNTATSTITRPRSVRKPTSSSRLRSGSTPNEVDTAVSAHPNDDRKTSPNIKLSSLLETAGKRSQKDADGIEPPSAKKVSLILNRNRLPNAAQSIDNNANRINPKSNKTPTVDTNLQPSLDVWNKASSSVEVKRPYLEEGTKNEDDDTPAAQRVRLDSESTDPQHFPRKPDTRDIGVQVNAAEVDQYFSANKDSVVTNTGTDTVQYQTDVANTMLTEQQEQVAWQDSRSRTVDSSNVSPNADSADANVSGVPDDENSPMEEDTHVTENTPATSYTGDETSGQHQTEAYGAREEELDPNILEAKFNYEEEWWNGEF